MLEGTPYHDASASCQSWIKLLSSFLLFFSSSLPRYGRDDADAECSDAPDHDAEHDAEGSATDGPCTAWESQLCRAPAHDTGNNTPA